MRFKGQWCSRSILVTSPRNFYKGAHLSKATKWKKIRSPFSVTIPSRNVVLPHRLPLIFKCLELPSGIRKWIRTIILKERAIKWAMKFCCFYKATCIFGKM